MARGYAADGNLAAAADLYAQAVELSPGFASAWFALGEAREGLGDREGARAAFERARAADPEDRRCAAPCAARRGRSGNAGAARLRAHAVRPIRAALRPRAGGPQVRGARHAAR